MDDFLRIWAQLIVTLTFVSSAAFCVTYHVIARWWENAFGRSLMIYQISMTLILGLSTVQTWTGFQHPALSSFGLAVFSVVPLALTWRLLVLIRAQRKAKESDDGTRLAE